MKQGKKRNKLGRPRKLTAAQLEKGVEAYFASISYMEPVMREEDVIVEEDPRTGAVRYALDEYGHRLTRLVPVCGADGKQLQRVKYIVPPGDYGLCDYLKISIDTWQRYGRMGEAENGTMAVPASSSPTGEAENGTMAVPASSSPTGEAESGTMAVPASSSPTAETGDEIATAAGRPRTPEASLGNDRTEDSEEAHYAEIYARARGRICAYLEQAAETKGGAGARFKLERIYGLTEDKHVEVSGSESLEAYLRSLGETVEY